MIGLNEFDPRKMNYIGQKFLDHFLPGVSVEDTIVYHPGNTAPDHLHIDIFRYDSEEHYYLFSVGCSFAENYNGNRCEVFFRFRNDLPDLFAKEILDSQGSLFDLTGYEKPHELSFLDDNEYYYDDNARELWFNELDGGNFCGFYIYEAFRIPTRPRTVYYEAVPASRTELDSIEKHYDEIPYKRFVSALKPHLGDRTDLKNCRTLSEEELQAVYEELAGKSGGK